MSLSWYCSVFKHLKYLNNTPNIVVSHHYRELMGIFGLPVNFSFSSESDRLLSGPLIALRGFDVGVIRWCSMHVINLGLLYGTNASTLTLADKTWFEAVLSPWIHTWFPALTFPKKQLGRYHPSRNIFFHKWTVQGWCCVKTTSFMVLHLLRNWPMHMMISKRFFVQRRSHAPKRCSPRDL